VSIDVPGGHVIPSGKNRRIRVMVSTRGRKGMLRKVIHIHTNDPLAKDINLRISMKVLETIVINPRYINFGTVLEGKEYKKKITILNKGRKKVKITNIIITPSTQMIRLDHVSPFILEPGCVKTFTLTFRPKVVKNGFIYGAAVFRTDLDYPSKVVVNIYARVQRKIVQTNK